MPTLTVDVTPLIKIEHALDRIIEGRLPHTQKAMHDASARILDEWHSSAANTPGLFRKDEYLGGLSMDKSITEAGPLAIDIMHTNPELAGKVHRGVAAHDMKPYLTGTLRGQPLPSNPTLMGSARESIENGAVVGRYNIIPYRTKAKIARPHAAKLAPTLTIISKGEKQKTQWGGRLTDAQMQRIASSKTARRAYGALLKARAARGMKVPSFEEFVQRFRGMTRTMKQYGKGKSSTYMTFRAVSVRNDGKGSPAGSWHHPGWGGKDFPRDVMATIGAEIKERILAGFAMDLAT
jgi:hypothetical protein